MDVQEKIHDGMKSVLVNKINQRIEALGLSQKDIEKGTGIDQRNLPKLLKGNGGLNQLYRVAHYLGLSIDENELELETVYWIKRRNEFKGYLLKKIDDGIKRKINHHLDLIRFTCKQFEADFNLLAQKEEIVREGSDWGKIQEDILKIVTKLVFAKFDFNKEPGEPVSIERVLHDDEYIFFMVPFGGNPIRLISVSLMIYNAFCEKYGHDFFYEEVVVKSASVGENQYVEDVVDRSSGKVLWLNPYV